MGRTSVYFHSSFPRRAVGNPRRSKAAMASGEASRSHWGERARSCRSAASKAVRYCSLWAVCVCVTV